MWRNGSVLHGPAMTTVTMPSAKHGWCLCIRAEWFQRFCSCTQPFSVQLLPKFRLERAGHDRSHFGACSFTNIACKWTCSSLPINSIAGSPGDTHVLGTTRLAKN